MSDPGESRSEIAASTATFLPRYAATYDDEVALQLADTLACARDAETIAGGGPNAVGRASRYAALEGASRAEATVYAAREKASIDGGPDKQGYPKRLPGDLEVVVKDGSTLLTKASAPHEIAAREIFSKTNKLWRFALPRAWRWSRPGAPLPLPRLG